MVGAEHVIELQSLSPEARGLSEGGIDYILLPNVQLPDGCTPARVDCLLCLGSRDGYENRLFFAQVVACRNGRNWNAQNVRIFERNWFAYSWRVPGGLRPIETLIGHLQGLR